MQAKVISSIKKLGIVAGNGYLPKSIEEFCIANNISYHLILIENQADKQLYNDSPCDWIYIGEVGKALLILKQENISHIIFVGGVAKPNFKDITLDLIGVKLLAKITRAKFFGDNNILSEVIEFIENYNYKVVGIEDLGISTLLANQGIIGKIKPSKSDLLDIEIGIEAASLLGKLDIGQAVIVENKNILSLEAAEGTDELIRRSASLKKISKKSGILIKYTKPQQDKRIDLPTIGEKTILLISDANFKGIALSSNSVIIDKDNIIKLANKLEIFIYGF